MLTIDGGLIELDDTGEDVLKTYDFGPLEGVTDVT